MSRGLMQLWKNILPTPTVLPFCRLVRGNGHLKAIARITSTDLKEVDNLLIASIASYNDNTLIQKTFKEPIELKHYRRQYVPFINSQGEREVYVNCFCTVSMQDGWKEHLVYVMDGGNCFFHVTVNLNKRTYEDFRVNLPA